MPDQAQEQSSAPAAAETGTEASSTSPNGSMVSASAKRLTRMLDEIAQFSSSGPGVTRLAHTPEERAAHALVASWLRELGLTISVDAAGNTLATLPGTGGKLPAIGTGSHLDSVPVGGRFDGIAGVVAGVEAIRCLAEQGTTLRHPLRVVAFAAEEGARFGQACLGSRAVAGLTTAADLHRLHDFDGVTVADAMSAVGLHPEQLPKSKWHRAEWGAFLELHVEQGSVLEAWGEDIGIVDLVSGSTRFELQFRGRASHSGGTPMNARSDALVAAAEVIMEAERIARDHRHRGTRVTVGRIRVEPGSITTIPGEVLITVDVRDIDSDRQRATAVELAERASTMARARGVAISAHMLADASPTVLPAWMREVLARACAAHSARYRVMTSGASHDTQALNRVVPAGLIFVPSRAGLSHVPQEWTASTQLAMGVRVLTEAIVQLDQDLTRVETAGGTV